MANTITYKGKTMGKQFLVIVTISDEQTLRETSEEGQEMELIDLVSQELNWIGDSGLIGNVIRELNGNDNIILT